MDEWEHINKKHIFDEIFNAKEFLYAWMKFVKDLIGHIDCIWWWWNYELKDGVNHTFMQFMVWMKWIARMNFDNLDIIVLKYDWAWGQI